MVELPYYETRKNPIGVIPCHSGHETLACPAHLHSHIELVYMREGRARVFVDSCEFFAEKGDAIFVFPYQVHHFLPFGAQKFDLLIIDPEITPTYRALFAGTPPTSPIIKRVGNEERLVRLFSDLTAVTQAPSSSYSAEITAGYLTALFGELLGRMSFDVSARADSHAVRSIVAFCSEHYAENLSLDSLEQSLHLNKYYISHIFSRKLRISFNTYLNSLRVSHACRYLQEREFSITDISGKVGYLTPRTFNRAFLQQMSCSPSDYRKRFAPNGEER